MNGELYQACVLVAAVRQALRAGTFSYKGADYEKPFVSPSKTARGRTAQPIGTANWRRAAFAISNCLRPQ